nr:uncharacterized protein LOC117691138 [Crassostrea gigas]
MCPDTEGKWKEAAAKKNCTAYASRCSEPARLVYHCVINTYANQTLEVCAYAQNILDGHCTEYNRGGNLLQGNIQTYCKTFTKKPCPKVYPSTRAYNYPGCYELAKKLNTVTVKPESTVNVTTKMDNGSNDLGKQIGALYMSLLVVLLSRLF